MTGWALAAAFASAFCYALAAAVQHREADQAPAARASGVPLMWHLCRQSRWLGGITAMAAGAALHTVALSFGPLPLVQPIGVAGLLFALPLGARLQRRRMRTRDWWAAAAVTAGLTMLLRVVRTPAHGPHLSTVGTLVLSGAVLVGVSMCVLWARHHTSTSRAVALAAGAGIAFGASSALVRTIGAHVVAAGPIALVGWPTLALAVVAPTGFVLCQHAYRDGSLGGVISTMTVVDPLTAIVFAAGLLGETWHTSTVGVAAAGGATVLMVAGIAVLAGRPTRRPSQPDASLPAPASLTGVRISGRPLTRMG
jgi:drug/metabolite transporter (DMT)-like permease